MVGCDNPACPHEWFHFECAGLKSQPEVRLSSIMSCESLADARTGSLVLPRLRRRHERRRSSNEEVIAIAAWHVVLLCMMRRKGSENVEEASFTVNSKRFIKYSLRQGVAVSSYDSSLDCIEVRVCQVAA